MDTKISPEVEDTDVTIQGQATPMKAGTQSENTPKKIITPRKQVKYNSPKRKFLTRKKNEKPETWKKNVRKHLRQSGKEYISATGKSVEAKVLGGHSCIKCRFNCGENINKERLDIFNSYWNLVV